MHVVIFTGGLLEKSKMVKDVIVSADSIVAADSGAKTALEFGVVPEAVLGDMDSIDPQTKHQLRQRGVAFHVSPQEKDETDTELAIAYALKNGATEITLLGGIYGDRIDHVLANVLLACLTSVPITFVNGLQKSFILHGPKQLHIAGRKNDLLSLIPLSGDVTGINSDGLQWELQNSTLIFGKPRGVSNVFLQEEVTLSLKKGALFVTHTTK